MDFSVEEETVESRCRLQRNLSSNVCWLLYSVSGQEELCSAAVESVLVKERVAEEEALPSHIVINLIVRSSDGRLRDCLVLVFMVSEYVARDSRESERVWYSSGTIGVE